MARRRLVDTKFRQLQLARRTIHRGRLHHSSNRRLHGGPQLAFTSPVATATAAAVVGNTAGKVTIAPFTVTGINWTDGSDLWLRWGDQQQKTIADNGLGIDNVAFSASIGTPPAGVAGDYNGNGVVDMADYVLWRNGGPLQNEVASTGTVDAADYDAWARTLRQHLRQRQRALGTSVVPEPTAIALLTIIGACSLTSRAPRRDNLEQLADCS